MYTYQVIYLKYTQCLFIMDLSLTFSDTYNRKYLTKVAKKKPHKTTGIKPGLCHNCAVGEVNFKPQFSSSIK